MITYFCRNCWKEIEKERSVCLHCGANQTALDEETFIAKLIRALNHPEPESAIRAAYILGSLKAVEAVPALLDTIRTSGDVFIVAAAVEALGNMENIGLDDVMNSLMKESIPLPVRSAAKNALEKLRKPLPQ
jgi:HEAT repeat protein